MALLGKTYISSMSIKELMDSSSQKHDAAFQKFLQECRNVARVNKKKN